MQETVDRWMKVDRWWRKTWRKPRKSEDEAQGEKPNRYTKHAPREEVEKREKTITQTQSRANAGPKRKQDTSSKHPLSHSPLLASLYSVPL